MQLCSCSGGWGEQGQPGDQRRQAQVLHQLQLLLLRALHLRRHRDRKEVRGLLRRENTGRQAVPVHRHLPWHLRAPVQEELRFSMG
jgi:hypothetical protein